MHSRACSVDAQKGNGSMVTLVGTAADNTIVNLSNDADSDLYGMDGDDRVTGNDGVDYIYGQNGDDRLNGGAGNDWLFGGQGADVLNGGDGIDTVSYYDAYRVTVALDGSFANTNDAKGDEFHSIENLVGSLARGDKLAGNGLDNKIWGLGGGDTIFGRGGDDSLSGESGRDHLFGNSGNDWLFGGAGADKLNGGAGRDGASYRDSEGVTVSLDGSLNGTGEAKGDSFVSIENLDGSATDRDVMAGNDLANSIFGNGGNDALYGRGGSDKLFGGSGTDALYGEAGQDVLAGNGGGDTLDGGAGNDTASYRDSAGVTVSLDGSLAADGAAKGDSFESIEYLSGSDKGDDTLAGDEGGNALWGNGGDDVLLGRAGSDFLFGGLGNDKLTGGAGADYFTFDAPGQGFDTITDFGSGDYIDLDSGGFGLPTGAVAENRFQSEAGHDAGTATIRLLFDTSSHSLWYDSDGSGDGAGVKIAVFSNDYLLAIDDIVVA
jgi:Ca2+-binding RTX toxin-like protein